MRSDYQKLRDWNDGVEERRYKEKLKEAKRLKEEAILRVSITPYVCAVCLKNNNIGCTYFPLGERGEITLTERKESSHISS